MSDNEAFDRSRREAKVTCAEIANYLGCNVRWLIGVIECGNEPVTPSMVNALAAIIEARG